MTGYIIVRRFFKFAGKKVEEKEDLALGLAFFVFFGLSFGLAISPGAGLIIGLCFGLAAWLANRLEPLQ